MNSVAVVLVSIALIGFGLGFGVGFEVDKLFFSKTPEKYNNNLVELTIQEKYLIYVCLDQEIEKEKCYEILWHLSDDANAIEKRNLIINL